MEEGEISTEPITSPKADVSKDQEISSEEKGAADENVPEGDKEEEGEIKNDEQEVKMDAESSDIKAQDDVPTEAENGADVVADPGSECQDSTEKQNSTPETTQESSPVKMEDVLLTSQDSSPVKTEDVLVTSLESEAQVSQNSHEKQAPVAEAEKEGGEDVLSASPGSKDLESQDSNDKQDMATEVENTPIGEQEDSSKTEDIASDTHKSTAQDTTETEEEKLDDNPPFGEQEDSSKTEDIALDTHKSTAQDTTETEDGELDDSDDEKENEKDAESPQTEMQEDENKPEIKESIEDKSPTPAAEKDEINEVKVGVSRIEFGIDESRPEEEQLDYGEDELEEKMRAEPSRPAERPEEKSDGEVDSASDGEIKSEEEGGEDFEEGETRDHPLDLPPEQKKVCKFFEMGNCTWGDRCRYMHPGINDKGNYNMFGDNRKPSREHGPPPPHFHPGGPHRPPPGPPFWDGPRPFMPPPPPAAETAWEKGLRHAKELKKRALQRKVQEPDFMQKREVLSLNVALNEDHDMEFVNHKPLAENNKGFDPFKEEDDEYATPTPEEVRRQLMRDRRRAAPPPHRPPHDKDRRLPPPQHMMPPDMRRDRRPPSPRHHPGPDRYPPDMRRLSPRRENDRDGRHHRPPTDPAFMQRHGDRRDRRDYPERPDNRGQFPNDPNRRDVTTDRIRDDKYQDGTKGPKGVQNGGASMGQSQQWNDPWARGRPQGKGRNKSKGPSSSSSGSSSGSSSRSSSRSSGSSHSSYSGSSRSSSGSSRSSSFSSNRDSSRSPSPSKNTKPKKKILSTAKQRNAAAAAPSVQKKQPATVPTPKLPISKSAAQVKPVQVTVPKLQPGAAKKPPDKKPVVPAVASNATKPPAVKKPTKPKKKTSSSSSEFSHSSDSSPSPTRATGKVKSGSDSYSGSSSSSSSFSSSSGGSSSSDSDEDDKPRNRRTAKPKPKPPALIPPATRATPLQQQQNKGKVMVPSKPGRKDVKMTIIDKPGGPKKRSATEMTGQPKKSSRRTELLEQLRAVEDAIARKRAKLT